MNKIKSFFLNNFLTYYVFLNIFIIAVFSICTTYKYSFYSIYGSSIVTLSIISCIICFLILILYKRVCLSDFLLILIILFGLIATIYAIYPKYSLYGFDGRYEGLFAITYYLCLLYISSNLKIDERKKIINAILLFGCMHVAYGFIVMIGFIKDVNGNLIYKIAGLTTNPNFFGSFMVICVSYVIGLFIDSKDKLTKILYLLLIVIFVYGIFVCNTTGSLVALIFVLLLSFVYIIINKKYLDFAIMISVILIFFIFLSSLGWTNLLYDFKKTSNEVVEISKGNVDDSYGTFRIKIWKKTIEVVPKYLLHGVGIDNFYYAFGDKPLTMDKWFFDKAHNEYLQILITQGIFSLICYLSLFFIIVMDGIINAIKNKSSYLVLPVIGYLVQAFFNISVIEVAPFFYIALGLIIDRDSLYLNRLLLKR